MIKIVNSLLYGFFFNHVKKDEYPFSVRLSPNEVIGDLDKNIVLWSVGI